MSLDPKANAQTAVVANLPGRLKFVTAANELEPPFPYRIVPFPFQNDEFGLLAMSDPEDAELSR